MLEVKYTPQKAGIFELDAASLNIPTTTIWQFSFSHGRRKHTQF